MKRVVIIQARMGSTRLPGKVLLPLAGVPMLDRVLNRLSLARLADEVVVATTTGPEDDALAAHVARRGTRVVRGSSDDVLGRYLAAAHESGAELVARVTSDCPFVDPAIVDHLFRVIARPPGYDYASNRSEPRSFPRGLDVEVCTLAALERAGRETDDPACREHVTLYLYEQPGRFNIRWVRWRPGLGDLRLTVDTGEDYRMADAVFRRLGRDDFDWREAAALLRREPWLAELNAGIRQKPVRPESEGA